MEDACHSQLEETSGKLEQLVSEEHLTSPLGLTIPTQQGFLRQTNDRSESLKQYDNHAARLLEERDVRYKEWKAWKPHSVSRIKGFRLGAKQKVPPIPTERALVAAYDHTGQTQEVPCKSNYPS
jgi:hypothetical protein